MGKRFILTLGVLLSSHLPAAAQTRPAQVSLTQESPAPIMTVLVAVSAQWPMATFLPARPLAERPARFHALLAAGYNRDRSPEPLSAVKIVKTPFARQARVAIVQLCGGRLQLDGFTSTSRMDNVVLGYSASGGHPAMTAPHGNRSYGISLTFHLGRDPDADRR